MPTLGSLFDGIGGFPLAGAMCGITPVWSSEIEPFPLKVTAARFPDVKQLGSVTDIDGGKIEPVDIITFGSPCQDLSVAGKQLGIHEGQRSNLFFEAVRIIKEMSDADTANGRTGEYIRPRFAVWENVPGAFSSNKGADFKAVLEALASVRQDGLHIPQPKKWNHAGCVVGDGWSIAWRQYDAQYWGVPQRRKRIYLVADFGGERAGEILFERESVRGNPAAGGEAREGAAADAEGGVGGGHCFAIDPLSSNSMKSNNPHSGFHEGQIAKCLDTRQEPTCNQGGNVIVQPMHDRQAAVYPRVTGALCANSHPGSYTGQDAFNDMLPVYKTPVVYPGVQITSKVNRSNPQPGDPAPTLSTRSDSDYVVSCAKPPRKYIVRRLTPIECARLQGMPDWWCEGLGGSDSAIYKAYGNGLALPCAYDVLSRLSKEYQLNRGEGD